MLLPEQLLSLKNHVNLYTLTGNLPGQRNRIYIQSHLHRKKHTCQPQRHASLVQRQRSAATLRYMHAWYLHATAPANSRGKYRTHVVRTNLLDMHALVTDVANPSL